MLRLASEIQFESYSVICLVGSKCWSIANFVGVTKTPPLIKRIVGVMKREYSFYTPFESDIDFKISNYSTK